jgi:hypothetical protein
MFKAAAHSFKPHAAFAQRKEFGKSRETGEGGALWETAKAETT